MEGGAFVHSLSIRGWYLGANINAFPLAALGDDVREPQSTGGEELCLRTLTSSLENGGFYNTHGHKLRFPLSKKAQFVTECGIEAGIYNTMVMRLRKETR
jgi:hypothetical protein